MDLEAKKNAFLEAVKPEVQAIGQKFYAHAKEALKEAALESKTPLDDMALEVLISAFEKKILEKLGA